MKQLSHSPDETMEVARRFASTLEPGSIVCLYGELGSGKTVFVKGVCSGLGVVDDVTSPSFVIATEYQGRMRIAHIDLYRLDTSTANDLHLEEYLEEKGVSLIEWADRLDLKGKPCLTVTIAIAGSTTREIVIEDSRH
jgi:tRNA threonylcarbamoyladenosine biosynthesis protein TsaE